MDKWKVCDQTMNQSEKILEIKDLCVEFKTVEGTVKAINHLNYTLHKGEKLGIVGESGSGKSVSSLGIMQLIPNPPGEIVGGEILYKGQDLVKKSEKDRLNHKFCGISDSSRSSVGSYRIASERNIRHQDIRIPVCEES